MKKIILASASPRRKELMTLTKLPFEIKVSDADETLKENISPDTAVEILSRRKAEAVKKDNTNAIIIGADTVVAINSVILGKPSDKNDAIRILKLLSGRVHQVYTGVTIIDGENIDTFSVKTDVEFYPLTDKEIDEYTSFDECYDKAGAYGIQGIGGLFVKKISGDYNNVVGLPVAEVYRKLKRIL